MRRIGTGFVCNAKWPRLRHETDEYAGACKGLQSKNCKVDVPEDTGSRPLKTAALHEDLEGLNNLCQVSAEGEHIQLTTAWKEPAM